MLLIIQTHTPGLTQAPVVAIQTTAPAPIINNGGGPYFLTLLFYKG